MSNKLVSAEESGAEKMIRAASLFTVLLLTAACGAGQNNSSYSGDNGSGISSDTAQTTTPMRGSAPMGDTTQMRMDTTRASGQMPGQ
jgi:hypothetical protein